MKNPGDRVSGLVQPGHPHQVSPAARRSDTFPRQLCEGQREVGDRRTPDANKLRSKENGAHAVGCA